MSKGDRHRRMSTDILRRDFLNGVALGVTGAMSVLTRLTKG